MKLVIGTDEAGYGPNIGPLVVTGSCWLIDQHDLDQHDLPATTGCPDLFDVFETLFCRVNRKQDNRIQIGDSKKIFKPGSGLCPLEKAVIPLFLWSRSTRQESSETGQGTSWNDFLDQLCHHPVQDNTAQDNTAQDNTAQGSSSSPLLPWYQGFNPRLPIDLDPPQFTEVLELIPWSSRSFPWGQRSRIVEAGPFNRQCEQLGNKANLLSATTLSVVSDLLEECFQSSFAGSIDQVFVVCDKHGGRNRYAGIIQSFFEDCWIQVETEKREHSRYCFHWNNVPCQFDFHVAGESHLPIAVASLFSKYVREICMLAFNLYWSSKKPDLAPTAGYPLDAKRFRKDICKFLPELGILEADWWRAR